MQLRKLERRKSFPYHTRMWELHSPGIDVLPDSTVSCLKLVSDLKVKPRAIKRTDHLNSLNLATGNCGARHGESFPHFTGKIVKTWADAHPPDSGSPGLAVSKEGSEPSG